MKSANNKTTKSFDSLATKRRVILSGTPIQNDLSEFYAMVDFSNPGLLGKCFRGITRGEALTGSIDRHLFRLQEDFRDSHRQEPFTEVLEGRYRARQSSGRDGRHQFCDFFTKGADSFAARQGHKTVRSPSHRRGPQQISSPKVLVLFALARHWKLI